MKLPRSSKYVKSTFYNEDLNQVDEFQSTEVGIVSYSFMSSAILFTWKSIEIDLRAAAATCFERILWEEVGWSSNGCSNCCCSSCFRSAWRTEPQSSARPQPLASPEPENPVRDPDWPPSGGPVSAGRPKLRDRKCRAIFRRWRSALRTWRPCWMRRELPVLLTKHPVSAGESACKEIRR